jgi:hypothetical protein
MMIIEGSRSKSGSISQRHGSADPDPDLDQHQNVMDPQHSQVLTSSSHLFIQYVTSQVLNKIQSILAFCINHILLC